MQVEYLCELGGEPLLMMTDEVVVCICVYVRIMCMYVCMYVCVSVFDD
jgi:hypothetical protein